MLKKNEAVQQGKKEIKRLEMSKMKIMMKKSIAC